MAKVIFRHKKKENGGGGVIPISTETGKPVGAVGEEIDARIKQNTKAAKKRPDCQVFVAMKEKHKGNGYQAIKDYFYQNIKDKPVETVIEGKKVVVNFSWNYTFHEIDDNLVNDPIKQEAVLWLQHIVTTGKDRANPMNKKHGSTEKFFSKEKIIRIQGNDYNVIVDIGFRPKTKDKYTAHGLLREGTFAYQRRLDKEKANDKKIIGCNSATLEALQLHSYCATDKDINEQLYVVNMKVTEIAPSSSDQAVLDHFCRRLAELGMDVFGLRKGA